MIIIIEIQGNNMTIPIGYIKEGANYNMVSLMKKGISSSIIRTSLLSLLIILPLGF